MAVSLGVCGRSRKGELLESSSVVGEGVMIVNVAWRIRGGWEELG